MFIKIKNVVALSIALLVTQSVFSVETVTLLDRGEPYASMVAQNGFFWVGHSRKQFNSNYKLEVYTTEGKLAASAPLSHSLSNIKKMGSESVMITGINPSSELTEYTVAQMKNGKLIFKTSQIDLGGFITFWVGNLGNQHFFVDQGGNPNDATTDFNLPAQTLFKSTGSQAVYLNNRVRMPVSGLTLNNKLLLVSSSGIGQTPSSIIEVDPKTQTQRVVTSSKTAKYLDIQVIPGTTDIISNAVTLNKLVVVDTVTGQTRRELTTQGYTRIFAITGHCVIAGNDENNTIEVFDLNSKEDKALFSEAVQMSANEFSGIKQIAVDEKTGTVFARSNLACNPLMTACSDDNNRVVSFGPSVAQKVLTSCH